MREPVQARSRERFDRILRAMETLLRNRAFEEVTIRDIALEADVPTGTLYQFFDGKYDLMEQLALEIEGELDVIVARELAPDKVTADASAAVGRLILAIDEMQQAHSGFLCLARTDPGAGPIGALAERLRDRVRERMDEQFAQAVPGLDAQARRGMVLMLASLMMSVFAQAPSRDAAGRAQFMAEASRMLALYLQDRLGGAGP